METLVNICFDEIAYHLFLAFPSYSISFTKLPQSTASIYKSLGFYERHLLPQNVGIIWFSPCESFDDIESEKSVYVRISKRKQAISAEDSNSYLDIQLYENCILIVL